MADNRIFTEKDARKFVQLFLNTVIDCDYINAHFGKKDDRQLFVADDDKNNTIVLATNDGLNPHIGSPKVSNLYIYLHSSDNDGHIIISATDIPVIKIDKMTKDEEDKLAADVLKLQQMLSEIWEED